MEYFQGQVYLASNLMEYVDLIKVALKENNPEKEAQRRMEAAKHTWPNSMQEISRSLEKVKKS